MFVESQRDQIILWYRQAGWWRRLRTVSGVASEGLRGIRTLQHRWILHWQRIADEYGFKFIDGDTHFLSAHIVFYDTKIKADELMTIMKHRYSSFVNHAVNPYVDPSVYTLSKRQLMRHVLLVKYWGPGAKYKDQNRDNAGDILNDLRPEHQIITPDGHDSLRRTSGSTFSLRLSLRHHNQRKVRSRSASR